MKSKFAFVLVGLCLGLAVFGCGAKESQLKSDDSATKVTEKDAKNGGIKVEREGTHAQIGGDTKITEEELGAPFYPGSNDKPGTAFKVETPTEKNFISVRETAASMKEIQTFYESKIKGIKIAIFNSGNNEMLLGTGKLPSGAEVSISATRKKGEKITELSVGTVTKK